MKKIKTPKYTPISNNIYFDGYSFRTRVRIDGVTKSFSTSDKKIALKIRNKFLKIKSLTT